MITIDRAQANDYAALLRVFQDSVHGLACADYRPDQLAAWAPRQLIEHDSRLWCERLRELQPWVARRQGIIAGYADCQPDGHIHHFFVHPDLARQGVGSALMQHIVAHATGSSEPLTLTAHVSLTAQPLFLRFGFEIVAVRRPVVLGVPLENALMRRPSASPLPAMPDASCSSNGQSPGKSLDPA